jgi:Fe-S-cluster-containing hydrogenase component 2
MSFSINELCVNCFACIDVCPNDAIFATETHFKITASKCTECVGDHDDAQCSSICPIEGAILDSLGMMLNPPGSLTGIPPKRMEEVMAEIQAR